MDRPLFFQNSKAMLKNILFSLSAIGLIIALSGCDQSGSKSDGDEPETAVAPPISANVIAVIDLDLIAQRTGSDQKIQAALTQAQNQINQQLGAMRQNFQTQVQQAAVTVQNRVNQGIAGPNEVASLEKDIANLNVQLQREQQVGQNKLSEAQINLINSFKNQVRPIVQQIARERGYGLVITKNETVIYTYDQAHDITLEVITRMTTPVVP
ncbi:MAG: Skp family chaperone for outer membrane protein [Verrucomicrobiales bacterium]|jgi:Skp family chaperone for outer membrane proteins